MFGSGLPVCALSYACIGELVDDGQTGLLFDSPRKLCDQLTRLLRGFPAAPSEELSHMREQVASKEGLRWQENWDNVAWPMLQSK
jgi:beta-1,4-mannosyltransferase